MCPPGRWTERPQSPRRHQVPRSKEEKVGSSDLDATYILRIYRQLWWWGLQRFSREWGVKGGGQVIDTRGYPKKKWVRVTLHGPGSRWGSRTEEQGSVFPWQHACYCRAGSVEKWHRSHLTAGSGANGPGQEDVVRAGSSSKKFGKNWKFRTASFIGRATLMNLIKEKFFLLNVYFLVFTFV